MASLQRWRKAFFGLWFYRGIERLDTKVIKQVYEYTMRSLDRSEAISDPNT
jgi:hypothetical protein